MSATGNDYAELCDLGPSRWSSRGYYFPQSSSLLPNPQHPTSSSSVLTGGGSSSLARHQLRSSSYEAEDIRDTINSPPGVIMNGPYGVNSRIGNSTSSLRGGRSGLYYSPPGTSYTIVERPHSPHYYNNTAGAPSKGGSLPGRGSAYLQSYTPSSHLLNTMNNIAVSPGTLSNIARHSSDNKKRPISPEQVLRMFGATTASSVPSSYHYSNGTKERSGRRSPASSPPSTTHQVLLCTQ